MGETNQAISTYHFSGFPLLKLLLIGSKSPNLAGIIISQLTRESQYADQFILWVG